MKTIFRMQRIMLTVYIVTAVATVIYALAFMTEYQNLFGLRLPLNKEIAQFHNVTLQTFNREILAWALGGVVLIAVIFGLEALKTVPDRFALVVLLAGLGALCGSAVYFLLKIPGMESTYGGLNITYLKLEGLKDYQFNFLPFTIGKIVYAVEAVVCAGNLLTLLTSHITFIRLGKEVHAG